jgi:hypothetical protein
MSMGACSSELEADFVGNNLQEPENMHLGWLCNHAGQLGENDDDDQ